MVLTEPVNVIYYNGTSSKQYKGTASLFGDLLQLNIEDFGNIDYPLAELSLEPRVGANSLRVISFLNGGSIEFSGDGLVDAIQNEKPARAGFHALAYNMESKLRYVMAGLLITVLTVWGFFAVGIPYMAKQIAYNLPKSADTYIGKDLLKTMDYIGTLKRSSISVKTQERLRHRFKVMVERSKDTHHFRLKFRKMGVPNAFALPSGIIVLTDKFVKLAKTDEEIVAVMAHEIGHVVHRHSMRSLIQTSATGIILTMFFGDASSMSTVAANLPAFLLFSKYSRHFETEADDYALKYLVKHNVSPMAFVTIMERLSGYSEKKKKESSTHHNKKKPSDFMSSHPSTYKRIEKFRQAAQNLN
ncbi:hypothetical protein MNBD_GAMMA12-1571 [hydrothermal vent metagenome]|uniref:Uncharacterized protein n=1 Tax=hydrothermal vent metagenome TaxID=652676 RepID=A0A3B0YKA9_9ZZZZ